MGKTNRLLSYLTKNIALTFENTKYAKNYSIHTGIPVRPKKEQTVNPNLKEYLWLEEVKVQKYFLNWFQDLLKI